MSVSTDTLGSVMSLFLTRYCDSVTASTLSLVLGACVSRRPSVNLGVQAHVENGADPSSEHHKSQGSWGEGELRYPCVSPPPPPPPARPENRVPHLKRGC